MPGTISTNDSRGLGYETGYFSGPVGTPVDQTYFNALFGGRLETQKLYKEVYNCNIVGNSTMSTWMEEMGGVEYDCNTNWTNLEYNGYRRQIREATGVTVPTRAGGTANLTLSNKDHFVSGAYVLPQIGNTIALTPRGFLAEVTAVTHSGANTTTVTVRQRSTTAAAQVIAAGDEMLVLQGSILTDCACPTGQFNFRDMPLEVDVAMIDIATKGELCGDAIEKCQRLMIPFLDENGNVVDQRWWTTAQADMFKDLEFRKHYEKLLNPTFGIVPNLRARGIKFSPAASDEITTDDIRDWKQGLDIAGIAGREFAVFCGREIFSQFQRMLLAAGVIQLLYSERPLNDCGWINMEYCGIKVEGITLHIYDDASFSSGKALGSVGMNFPASAIFVPLWNRPLDAERSVSPIGREDGYSQNKMFVTTYFQSLQGRRYDMFVDSNGILNGPNGRNTFSTGCKEHEWTAESRFTQELFCLSAWGYIGLV